MAIVRSPVRLFLNLTFSRDDTRKPRLPLRFEFSEDLLLKFLFYLFWVTAQPLRHRQRFAPIFHTFRLTMLFSYVDRAAPQIVEILQLHPRIIFTLTLLLISITIASLKQILLRNIQISGVDRCRSGLVDILIGNALSFVL